MPKTIVVSGFGPFVGHEERNASWEAVKLLPDICQHKGETFRIVKYEIPVTYEAVDRMVPKIWAENPTLVVHVGVHGRIDTINLEMCSYTTGYCKEDYANQRLPCDKITLKSKSNCEMIRTNLNTEKISKELCLENNVKCVCSEEVGNYLCGYIYLKSLDISPDRSLFIHVPNVDAPYSSEETKSAIHRVIGKCLEQLDEQGKL